MKNLYLNPASGISGDMFLGAMLDLDVPEEALSSGLAQLSIRGLKIKVSKVDKRGITATKVEVIAPDTAHARHLSEILAIIRDSRLPKGVTGLSEAVFRRLGAAEAKVHGIDIEQVHFHEVGALDTIADVVGAAICLKAAGIGQVFSGPVNTGSGMVRTSHGLLPVPAPATAELLKGVTTYTSGVSAELTTPTGAAILAEICNDFGPMPKIKPLKTGYGAGSKDLDVANVLMATLGKM
jgi:uncharacterized protein (TIGR00299 family) protein